MAQTIEQLIANGQQVYDETAEGANTHQRIGTAFLQIPETIAMPIRTFGTPDANTIEAYYELEAFYTNFALPTEALWYNGMHAIWCAPPQAGVTPYPPLDSYKLIYLAPAIAPNSHGDSINAFEEFEAEFGPLAGYNGQRIWIINAYVDEYGRHIGFTPVQTTVTPEP